MIVNIVLIGHDGCFYMHGQIWKYHLSLWFWLYKSRSTGVYAFIIVSSILDQENKKKVAIIKIYWLNKNVQSRVIHMWINSELGMLEPVLAKCKSETDL